MGMAEEQSTVSCVQMVLSSSSNILCDWWFNVDCSLAEQFYSINDENAAERAANSPAGTGGAGQYQEGSVAAVEVAVGDVVDLGQDVEVAPVVHWDLLLLQEDHIQVLQVLAKALVDPKVLEMVTLEQTLLMVPQVDTQEETPGGLIQSQLNMELTMTKMLSLICKCLTTQK